MASARLRRIIRLRATLVGSDPEIWRTVDVDQKLSLAQLHQVLQAAFGWRESHLHRFSQEEPWGRSHGIPRIGRRPRVWVDQWSLTEEPQDDEEDETETTVAEAFQHDGPLWYLYDFGDGWVHRVDVIERVAGRLGEGAATIVAGERRAPFEDSGGLGGYDEKLAIIADPQHPEHEWITDWATGAAGLWGTIDPDDADLDGAQGELDALFGEQRTDMSGLVDPERGIEDDSPIAAFAAALPVGDRINLRRHVRRVGLLDPVEFDADEASELVRGYTWLLRRIGAEGMTLTQAGWMPPAAVREGMVELGWDRRSYGQMNRENLTAPMASLRASAEGLRLIRKVKGRLELVARTRPLVDDPMALTAHVARMLLRQRMSEAQRTAGTLLVISTADGSLSSPLDAVDVAIGGLNELEYVSSEGQPVDHRWFHGLTEPVLDVLRTLGLWRDHRFGADEPPSDALRRFARLALR